MIEFDRAKRLGVSFRNNCVEVSILQTAAPHAIEGKPFRYPTNAGTQSTHPIPNEVAPFHIFISHQWSNDNMGCAARHSTPTPPDRQHAIQIFFKSKPQRLGPILPKVYLKMGTDVNCKFAIRHCSVGFKPTRFRRCYTGRRMVGSSCGPVCRPWRLR